MTTAAIEFKKVSLSRAGNQVLTRLDLRVSAGETLVLLGESGSGKTTILRLANRLLDPDEGEVRIEGRPGSSWDPILLRRRVGYVIQEAGLFPHFTVAGNIGLPPSLQRWPPERIAARVDAMLALVGLDPAEFRSRYPHELSGGQRQRVGVARALAADPPILLMDEPFGALDPVTRAEIQREFKDLQRGLRKTVLFVTHDIAEAFFLGDRVALLEGGRLVVCASPADLLDSGRPEVERFLGPIRMAWRGPQGDPA